MTSKRPRGGQVWKRRHSEEEVRVLARRYTNSMGSIVLLNGPRLYMHEAEFVRDYKFVRVGGPSLLTTPETDE